MSLGSLLVHTAGKRVLIDLGWGPNSGVTGEATPGRPQGQMVGGSLVANLQRLGVRPEEIDAVLFSHLHRDHTGWLIDPASMSDADTSSVAPTFPNATHYLSQPEWDYWCEQTRLGMPFSPSPEQLVILESRLSFVSDGETILPGIDTIESFGHTPGHLCFAISSGRDRALVLGDAVHCAIEMIEPELVFAADIDPDLARRTRAHIAQTLMDSDSIAAAPHFADFVFGRLLRGEGKAQWHFPDTQVLSVAQ